MPQLLLNLPPNRVRRNYRGGALLDRWEGRPRAEDGDRPEDWIASTVEARNPGLPPEPNEGLARVPLAEGGEALLRDRIAEAPEHFLGAGHAQRLGADLGFLVKFLDSAMRLHVQAHPTAAFARKHLDSHYGKLETYVILAVRPGCEAAIRLGFQRPPAPEEWKRIVYEQDIPAMDACFDPVPVRPGEAWVVPGGLPHAIGAGLLVLEVMEPTDLVVRCEFEREGIVVPPEARFMGQGPDFAMRIFDYTPLSVQAVTDRCRLAPQETRSGDGWREERLIGPEATDCFEVFRITVQARADLDKCDEVWVGVVSSGAGTVRAGDETLEVRQGSRFLAAGAADGLTFAPEAGERLEVLVCRPGAAARGSSRE